MYLYIFNYNASLANKSSTADANLCKIIFICVFFSYFFFFS